MRRREREKERKKLSQPAYNRKKRKRGKEFHSLARLICRRVSDSVALTNELWKEAGKDWCRGSDRKKESMTRRAKGSGARGAEAR